MVNRRRARQRGERFVWYRGEKFGNGITWVRLSSRGLGLWWRDSRIAGPSDADAPGWLVPVGPYRVRLLCFDREQDA